MVETVLVDRRTWWMAILSAALMTTAVACDKKASPGAASKAAPKLERKAEGEPAKAAKADDKKAEAAKTKAPEPKPAAAAPAAKAQPKADKPVPAAADAKAPAKAAAAKGQVSADECRKACDNVLKISVADMKKTAPKVRGAIEKRVKEDCPKQCLKHGSKASVDCLAAATTASALAACPR